jgi:hypothetical protein
MFYNMLTAISFGPVGDEIVGGILATIMTLKVIEWIQAWGRGDRTRRAQD